MSSSSSEKSEKERRLEQALAEYLHAVDRGEPVDSQAMLRKHPDLHSELTEFFRNRKELQPAVDRMRAAAAETSTVGLAERTTSLEPARVRYFGDYELLQEIGRGGMGVVYKARQVSLNRPVAVKMILSGQLASAEDVQRFRSEAEAAANLDHPHIAPIYETGEHQGQHYFSMKLIEGGSLREALPELRRDLRRGIRLLAQVARAVHHAHQRGVLHRDLKPGNILLDADAQPYVTDFGLAKRVEGGSDVTHTGAVVGTPAYMAPEQASAVRQLTTAVDIYSLGAVLYELLTGQPPFQGRTVAETLMQVTAQEPVSVRKRNREVDRDLDTICARCLEKDPARRYDSAAALADDLERRLRGEPIAARRISTAARGLKWAKRHPAAAVAAAVTALACISMVVVLAISNVRIRTEQENTRAEQRRTQKANDQLTREQAATTAALERLRHVSYAQTMALIRNEYEANNLDRARRMLEASPAELRHWEWDYLHRLCHAEERSLEPPSNQLRSIAYSPDGKTLAVGGGSIGFGPFLGQQELISWDVAEGKRFPAFRSEKPFGAINGLAWSPDGEHIALSLWCMTDARDVVMTAGQLLEECSGRIEIWSVKQAKLVHSLMKHQSFVQGVAYSPDGAFVASAGSDKAVNVWDTKTGERVHRLEGHQGQVMCAAFNRDGSLIVTGGQGPLSGFGSLTPNDMGEVKLWDAQRGELKLSLGGHERGVLAVAFSPVANLVASASRDRTVKLWSSEDGKLLRTLFGHTGEVTSLAFSGDGKRLATASFDRTVRLWSVEDGAPLAVLRGHTLMVTSVSFHPDGRHLASCALAWGGAAEIKTWDLEELPGVKLCDGTSDNVYDMQIGANGKHVAATVAINGSRDYEVEVWDAATGRRVLTLTGDDGYPSELRLSSDGQRLLHQRGTDVLTLKTFELAGAINPAPLQTQTFRQFENEKPVGNGVSPAITRDGQRMATYSFVRNEAVFLHTQTGEAIWHAPLKAGDSMEFFLSGDSQTLALVNQDRIGDAENWRWAITRIKAWEVATGKELAAYEVNVMNSRRIAVSNAGKLLAIAGEEQDVRLWPLTKDSMPHEMSIPEPIQNMAFSPDDRTLATVHLVNQKLHVHLWEMATGKKLLTLDDFAAENMTNFNYGREVVFSPDGRRLFTCGDGSVKIWDTRSGALLLALQPAYSPMRLGVDGRRVTAAGPQGTVQTWHAEPPR